MTFSLSPRRSSIRPLTDASVSTRVVSWNDAAEMKLSVERDALVIPSSRGCQAAGSPPSAATASLRPRMRERSICSPGTRPVSPGSTTSAFRSIWRTMTSMCLSLIRTPCRR